jgi:hypothetical protein
MRRLAVLMLAAMAVAGCSGGGPPSAHPPGAGAPRAALAPAAGSPAQSPAARRAAHPVPGLTARVILSGHTITAGSSLRARVVVENRTGHARHVAGCLSLFQVVLTSRRYHPDPAWPDCLQQLTIPAGRSAYRMTVEASYGECTQGSPSGGLLSCLPGGGMPPLPPGTYRARLFQSVPLIPAPPPVTVHVIPPPAR